MKHHLLKVLSCTLLFMIWCNHLFAQCTTLNVDLTGNPDSIWRSGQISRNGLCCGASGNQECISFNITLDPRTGGIWFYMTGAPALGSEFYQFNCTGQHSMRDTICLSGIGPHQITFCKPGGNDNEYIIEAIAQPTFPPDDSVRIGCGKTLTTYGVKPGTITWNSIYPGTPGSYNSYLSCTDCLNPTVTPASNAPAYVDYYVCGKPIASNCGYSMTECDTVRIYFFQPLTGSVNPNPASFCNLGANPGIMLTATGSGGNGVYSYKWRNSSGVVVGTGNSYYATNNQAYTVEINDGLSSGTCPGVFVTVPVSVASIPVVNAGADQFLCPANPVVSLFGSVSNASGCNWIGGNGTFNPGRNYLYTAYTPTAAEIAAGTLQLILQSTGSGGGCPNPTDTVMVYFPQPLNVSLSAGDIPCNNSTATISSAVTGGMLPYSYQWSTGAVTPSITMGQGAYQLLVTDAIGCETTGSISLSAPTALTILMSSTATSVDGGSDGSATANVSGGTPPYTYSWNTSPVQTGVSATGLSYGVYQVNVTDSKGCQISGSVVVNEPRCLGFDAAVTNYALNCHYDQDGMLVSTVSGGVPPYSYSWSTSPAQFTSNATNLSAGSYLLTVTDNNSCVQVAYGTVTEPVQLTDLMSHTNVSVVGGNNGTATANPNGGTAAYSYLWSTGASSQSISNLAEGTYTVTITDQNKCSTNDTVTILEPLCNNLLIGLTMTNALCYGSSSGSATVYVMRGTAPVNISWSTGASSSSISNLLAGNYWVKVKDAINCEETIYFTVTEPSPLSVVLAPTEVSCNGMANGSIETTVSGGTYPYTFQWANGMSAEDLYNLFAGNYSLIVTDANGCTDNDQTAVSEPAPLSVSYATSDPTCYNSTNGSVDLTVTGGVLPYSYSWSNGLTTQDISNIGAGYYLVTVVDANGCSNSTTLPILMNQPDSLRIDSSIVYCSLPGASTAQVQLFASGGVGTYTYSLDNGNTYQAPGTSDFMLPINNSYTVVLMDANNCVLPVPYILNIDPAVSISAVNYSLCYYASSVNAAVTVTAIGGDGGPYSISSDGGATFGPAGSYSLSLPIGNTYILVAKDGKGCISLNDTIVIPDALLSSISVSSNYNGQNVSCNGVNDAAIELNVSGGSGAYSYAWSNGSTTQDLNNVGAGSYNVSITDQNGCVINNSIVINEPAQLNSLIAITSNYNGQNISCNGSSDGSLDLTVTGGTGTYSYSWSNAQTTEDLSGLAAGSYNVTITDANGCAITDAVTISEPSAMASTIAMTSNYNGQYISCYGNADASLDLTVIGGTGVYTYLWSNSVVNEDLSGLGAGQYIVNVTDANGCLLTDTVKFSGPSELTGSIAVTSDYNGQNISCFGFADGSVDLTVNGGTGSYSYAWSNTSTSQDLSGIGAGSYSVIITDANGCTTNSSVVLNQPDAVSSTLVITSDYNGKDVTCFGATDGSVDLTVTGGTGVYSYNWSNGSTTQDLNGIGAGTYSVTILDANSCVVNNMVTLSQPASINSTITVTTNYNGQQITCQGQSDGAIDLTVSGGAGPYTYYWSNSATTEDLSGLTAGTYIVTITDNNNCSTMDTIAIAEPGGLQSILSITSDYNGQAISCNGGNDASIDLTVNGGTMPYSYAWSNGENSEDIVSVDAGTYYVTVTDINGCVSVDTIIINQPSALSSSIAATSNFNGQNISCNGMNDGTIDINVAGGTQPYTYQWSNNASSQNISGLTAGSYTVTVTDANGCTSIVSALLTEPSDISGNISIVSDYNGASVSCTGSNDGAIDLAVSGGTGPYTYIWSNGSTNEDLNNVSAGSYNVSVMDVNGCQYSTSISINDPLVLSSALLISSNYNGQNISCNGASDGIVDLSVSGGTGAYSYTWSNGLSTQDISNVAAGSYMVTITDANGCTTTNSITVNEPAAINSTIMIVSNYNTQHITCFGNADGAIDLSVSGGTGAYSYQWSNGSVIQDPLGLSAGTYSVLITDVNGCTATNFITLDQPEPLNSSLAIMANFNGQNVSCFGAMDGSIDLTVSGGTQTYSYTWSNGSVVEDPSGLSAGIYSVIITDANGCTTTGSVTLTQPDALQANLAIVSDYNGQNISCAGANDGAINLSVNGGTGALNYTWSNGATTQNISGLTAGSYTVNITDMNGCSTSATIAVSEPQAIHATIMIGSDYNGQSISCYGAGDGAVDLSVNGGTGSYSFNWSTGATNEDLNGLMAGDYTVTVTDINGCTTVESISIGQPDPLNSVIVSVTNFNGYELSCFGSSDGALDMSVSGGSGGYSYSWSNGATSEDLSGISAGTYNVTITDINGCSTTNNVTLMQPDQIMSTFVTTSFNGYEVSCNGQSDGSIDLSVTGGTGSYSYVWTNGANTEDLNSLTAGTYTVAIIDANGCTSNNTVVLAEPMQMAGALQVVSNYNGQHISCFGASDGALELSVNNGVGSLYYYWSNGANTQDISGLAAGTYSVTITDDNGCTIMKDIQLTQPDELTILPVITNISCNGSSSGAINLSVSGGTQGYSYSWSNGVTTEDLSNLSAGSYTLNLTDMNGCMASYLGEITQEQPISIAPVVKNANCSSNADGAVKLNISGGVAPFDALWSNGKNEQDIDGLSAGVYTVTVKDANNCSATETVTITQPEPIKISLSSYQYNNGYNISLHGLSDGSIDATITGGAAPYQTVWSNNSTSEDLHNIPAGDFELFVTDYNGCVITARLSLTQPLELEMPNGISPNGDGKNDRFVVHGLESYPDNEIEIYNRWGNIVYSAKNYNNQWRGVNNSGEELPDATYFVVLNINNGEIVLKGYVDLRR